jgi:dipeptidyl aminopeptidase/acylaminoacyl peptidase
MEGIICRISMPARLLATLFLAACFEAPARAQEFYAPKTLFVEGASITALAFSPNGGSIAFSKDDGSVLLRDVQSEAVVQEFTWQGRQVGAMSFSPDGSRLVLISFGKEMSLWDPVAGKALKEATASVLLADVAFSPDGTRFLAPGQDGKLHLFDAATLDETGVIAVPGALITSGSFSPDGKFVATVSLDKAASVWEVATGRETARFPHDVYLNAARFSADGAKLATAGRDGTVTIFDMTNGAEIMSLRAGEDDINDVAFSPDGSRLATASADDTIVLWDTATGTVIATLKGHISDVASLWFGGNNTTIYSIGRDATGRVWNLRPPPPSGNLSAIAGVWRTTLDPGAGEVLPPEIAAMMCQAPVRVQANGLILFYQGIPPDVPTVAQHYRCGADGECKTYAGEPAPGLAPIGTARVERGENSFSLCEDGACLDFERCDPFNWSAEDKQSGYDRVWTSAMEKAWE